MANTPQIKVRAEPSLIGDVAARHGLSAGTPVSVIIRFALALAANRPDPLREAIARPGPKPRAGNTA